jgi:hypothetical protein
LAVRVKVLQADDGIAGELDARRRGRIRRPDVEQAAAQRDAAGIFDDRISEVTRARERPGQIGQVQSGVAPELDRRRAQGTRGHHAPQQAGGARDQELDRLALHERGQRAQPLHRGAPVRVNVVVRRALRGQEQADGLRRRWPIGRAHVRIPQQITQVTDRRFGRCGIRGDVQEWPPGALRQETREQRRCGASCASDVKQRR